jgi:hypothetical protein
LVYGSVWNLDRIPNVRRGDQMTESARLAAEAASATALARPTRKRGVGFPVVGLPEAVEIMKKAGEYGSEHKLSAFAGYMGHSTANSGSFKRRIAAFKDWKFIASGTGDRVVFTELGRRVAYPTDGFKTKSDLQEAFRNCEIFWKVYDESAKGVPLSLGTLANLAVRQLGVAPISKDRFADSLAASAVAAGFADMDGGTVFFVEPGNETTRQHDDILVSDEDSSDMFWLEDELREPEGLPTTRRPSGDRERSQPSLIGRPYVRPSDLGIGSAPGGDRGEWRDDPGRRTMGLSSGASERSRLAGPVAGRDMTITGPPEKPATLYQQSWDFKVGNVVFEIKSSQSLPPSAFTQIGKVLSEVEKLKDMLTEGSDRSDEPTQRTE